MARLATPEAVELCADRDGVFVLRGLVPAEYRAAIRVDDVVVAFFVNDSTGVANGVCVRRVLRFPIG